MSWTDGISAPTGSGHPAQSGDSPAYLLSPNPFSSRPVAALVVRYTFRRITRRP